MAKGMPFGREVKKPAKSKPKGPPMPPARGLGKYNDAADSYPGGPNGPASPPPFPIKGKKKGGR